MSRGARVTWLQHGFIVPCCRTPLFFYAGLTGGVGKRGRGDCSGSSSLVPGKQRRRGKLHFSYGHASWSACWQHGPCVAALEAKCPRSHGEAEPQEAGRAERISTLSSGRVWIAKMPPHQGHGNCRRRCLCVVPTALSGIFLSGARPRTGRFREGVRRE